MSARPWSAPCDGDMNVLFATLWLLDQGETLHSVSCASVFTFVQSDWTGTPGGVLEPLSPGRPGPVPAARCQRQVSHP